jgi:hypothetical protein
MHCAGLETVNNIKAKYGDNSRLSANQSVCFRCQLNLLQDDYSFKLQEFNFATCQARGYAVAQWLHYATNRNVPGSIP